MKSQTVIGALIAAVITGLTAALTLLTGENVTKIGDISQLQWIVLGIGVALAFFKDFQAITTRKLIGKVTGTGEGK